LIEIDLTLGFSWLSLDMCGCPVEKLEVAWPIVHATRIQEEFCTQDFGGASTPENASPPSGRRFP
jgi:hypothetical protein